MIGDVAVEPQVTEPAIGNSETGRPSIDPELMMRMLIVGYGFGVRSERRLCEEVHLNLAHRRRSVAKVEVLDPTSSRAVAEYLSVLDDAAFGGATPIEPNTEAQ